MCGERDKNYYVFTNTIFTIFKSYDKICTHAMAGILRKELSSVLQFKNKPVIYPLVLFSI